MKKHITEKTLMKKTLLALAAMSVLSLIHI